MTMMGIIIMIAIVIWLFQTTSSESNIKQHKEPIFNSREDYEILGKCTGEAYATGPRSTISDQEVYYKAYNKALSKFSNADGLLNARFEYRRKTTHLILFRFVSVTVTVTGTAYKLQD